MKESLPGHPVLGTAVRVAHVYTPAVGFNGYRNRIRFANGEASLREPQIVDFNNPADWLHEHEAFSQIVNQFKKTPGYRVSLKAEVDLDELDEVLVTANEGEASSFFDQPEDSEPLEEAPVDPAAAAIEEALEAVQNIRKKGN